MGSERARRIEGECHEMVVRHFSESFVIGGLIVLGPVNAWSIFAGSLVIHLRDRAWHDVCPIE